MRKNKRRSPHKHVVHTKHSRYKVSSYDRGKGDKAVKRARRRKTALKPLTKKVKEPTAKGDVFEVRVEYLDHSYEHVVVDSPTYVEALDRGLDNRKRLKIPHMIRLRQRG